LKLAPPTAGNTVVGGENNSREGAIMSKTIIISSRKEEIKRERNALNARKAAVSSNKQFSEKGKQKNINEIAESKTKAQTQIMVGGASIGMTLTEFRAASRALNAKKREDGYVPPRLHLGRKGKAAAEDNCAGT
jgi:hypothetical protein